MKKITLLLVIIFTFLFSTSSWGEWTYVTRNEGGKTYYDKNRVRKSGKYLYFWELGDFIKPTSFGDLSFTQYIQLDCSIFRYKRLKIQTYNKSMGEGKMRLDIDPEDKWSYPKPETVAEITYNKVCEEHQKNYVSLDVKKREVIYWGKRDGKSSFYREKWEGLETEENIDYIKYEGDTVKGIPNGQGTFTWSSGKKYVGEFKDGLPNGQGTETFPSGTKYVGGWKDGERNGQGTETNFLGVKYVGGWKDGKENGQGTQTFQIGEEPFENYVGSWKNGERHGQGTYTYPTSSQWGGPGTKYVGEHKENKRWNGIYYDKDGKITKKVVNGKEIKQ